MSIGQSLAAFRAQFPWARPWEVVVLRGADDAVNSFVEIVSWPWLEDGESEPRIKIRTVVGDPMTMAETNVSNLRRMTEDEKFEEWSERELREHNAIAAIVSGRGMTVPSETRLPVLNEKGEVVKDDDGSELVVGERRQSSSGNVFELVGFARPGYVALKRVGVACEITGYGPAELTKWDRERWDKDIIHYWMICQWCSLPRLGEKSSDPSFGLFI